jgi:hypothetical protein
VTEPDSDWLGETTPVHEIGAVVLVPAVGVETGAEVVDPALVVDVDPAAGPALELGTGAGTGAGTGVLRAAPPEPRPVAGA